MLTPDQFNRITIRLHFLQRAEPSLAREFEQYAFLARTANAILSQQTFPAIATDEQAAEAVMVPVGLGIPPEPAMAVSWAMAFCPAESVSWASTVLAAAVWMLSWLTGVGMSDQNAEQPLKVRNDSRKNKIHRILLRCVFVFIGFYSNNLGSYTAQTKPQR